MLLGLLFQLKVYFQGIKSLALRFVCDCPSVKVPTQCAVWYRECLTHWFEVLELAFVWTV